MSVTVIIPTTDRVETLRRLLPRYLDQEPVSNVLVVWDGRSPPPDFGMGKVRVVQNRRTPGLPGARNAGLDECGTDFFVFGEDDAYPEPGAIAEMMAVWKPGRLVGPNLFEQRSPDQSAADVRAELEQLGVLSVRWRMAWTTDLRASERAIKRGTTALVLGKVDELAGLRFDEGLLPPTFHMEDVDFQLGAIRRGVMPHMATRAAWVHLHRGETGATGCRSSRDLGEYVKSIVLNDLRVFDRHADAIRDFYGIGTKAEFTLTVTARAALRRIIWYIDFQQPRLAKWIDRTRVIRDRLKRRRARAGSS